MMNTEEEGRVMVGNRLKKAWDEILRWDTSQKTPSKKW